MSMVLLVVAFAAMRPGNPQLLVILIARFTITAPFGVVGSVSVDVVDPALRATAVSMVAPLAQNLFGFAVGPLVVGVVSDVYGLKAALAVIPVFCAFAAYFLASASRRHYDKRPAPGRRRDRHPRHLPCRQGHSPMTSTRRAGAATAPTAWCGSPAASSPWARIATTRRRPLLTR